ncbi:MAG: sigma-70 family RNA polymerase sigma factor [Planctomycetes bacterium]|nr:sigma-70 family RNA polymerase sigma factor [Planctomycetota bacterium]
MHDNLNDTWWEEFRSYLRLLLDVQVDPTIRSKTDLSGVVQQTLLDAHQASSLRQSPMAERAAWLRRVLANNLNDELRKYRSDKRDVGRELPLNSCPDDSFDHLAELAVEGSSPSTPLRREETALRVAAALDCLPAAQREAIVLQHWHGWTLAQIATHLGRTRMAVAGLLKRGLRQLREELRDLK